MIVKDLTLFDFEEWRLYIDALLDSEKDIYFSDNYLKIFKNNREGDLHCFLFKVKKKIALYPFLLNNINKLGFDLDKEYFDIQGAYGYNGVITNCFETDFINMFYQHFYKYCMENCIIAEFTRFHPLIGNQKFSQNHMKTILDRETVALDLLQSYENIWVNQYSSKNRNMIRKAQNLGYTVKITSNPSMEEINSFISIYYYGMKMARADEYYFFNDEFFYNTFSYLRDNYYLFTVLNNEDEIVCSSIFFSYGDYFHYHLSGRNSNADNSVNNLLLDEGVKFAQSLNAKIFHFGGGRSSDSDDSLLKFKSNFSKLRLPFYIGKKIHNEQVYEEVVKQWELKYPEKIVNYTNHLLKYRY